MRKSILVIVIVVAFSMSAHAGIDRNEVADFLKYQVVRLDFSFQGIDGNVNGYYFTINVVNGEYNAMFQGLELGGYQVYVYALNDQYQVLFTDKVSVNVTADKTAILAVNLRLRDNFDFNFMVEGLSSENLGKNPTGYIITDDGERIYVRGETTESGEIYWHAGLPVDFESGVLLYNDSHGNQYAARIDFDLFDMYGSQLITLPYVNPGYLGSVEARVGFEHEFTPSTNPELIGTYSDFWESFSVAVRGNLAFVGDNNGLTILDISEPTSPTFVGFAKASNCDSVFLRGRYAYVAYSCVGTTGFGIIDVSDSTAPTMVGTFNQRQNIALLEVRQNIAYLADYSKGLVIVDVSDPTAPEQIGQYPYGNQNEWVMDLDIVGNLAYLGYGTRGLEIVDITNPSAPEFVGSYNEANGTRVFTVDVRGNIAYLGSPDINSGLKVVDVSNPSAPTLLTADNNIKIWYQTVQGDYLYASDYQNGLQIIDITNPSTPTLISTFDSGNRYRFIDVQGQLAFMVEQNKGLQIIDLTP